MFDRNWIILELKNNYISNNIKDNFVFIGYKDYLINNIFI